tara:strand:+ start:288 stop:512 length:225 start_codon:yes stop_codon:yes gene_type:complete
MEYITIEYKGQSVQCWGGALKEEDNIIMAYDMGCEGIVDNHNYKTDEAFKNWREAVKYLIDLDRFGEIDQLESC